MKLLFLMPHPTDKFPRPDSVTTFTDWLSFSDENHLYNLVNYFDYLDDLQKASNKDKVAPILICHTHTGMGNQLHFMKRKGKRIFGINNIDYVDTRMSHTYAVPMLCETFEELMILIKRFETDRSLTYGILKTSMIGFREGKSIET